MLIKDIYLKLALIKLNWMISNIDTICQNSWFDNKLVIHVHVILHSHSVFKFKNLMLPFLFAFMLIIFWLAWCHYDWQGPVVIVPTKYYTVPTDLFREWGISLVIWANHNLRASISAMQDVTQQIYEDQSLVNVEKKVTGVECTSCWIGSVSNILALNMSMTGLYGGGGEGCDGASALRLEASEVCLLGPPLWANQSSWLGLKIKFLSSGPSDEQALMDQLHYYCNLDWNTA